MDLSRIPVQHCTDNTRNLSQLKFSRLKLGKVRRHCWAGTSLTDPDGSFNPEATACTVGNEMGQRPRSSWHGTAFVLRTGWMSVRSAPWLVLFLTLLRRLYLGKRWLAWAKSGQGCELWQGRLLPLLRHVVCSQWVTSTEGALASSTQVFCVQRIGYSPT